MFKTAIASCAVHLVPLVLHLTSVALMALWLKYPLNLLIPLETCLLFLMWRNLCPRYPLSTKDLRLCNGFYNCRETITNVVSALQIHFFMQNKPNFRKVKLNLNQVLTRDYEQLDTWSIRKNEPKTNPIEPKTNPILANKTPIRTQFKPNLSCRSLWRSRNKANFRGAHAR